MYFELTSTDTAHLLCLCGDKPQNVLSHERVLALTECIGSLAMQTHARPLIITGNQHFFSAGANLNEIAALTGAEAYAFAAMGQRLMQTVAEYPAPTYAAVEGWCMGGGFDLALACQSRVCSPHAIFGHRGAALGIMTGWGGTQRLPRLVGKALALEIFIAAEKIHANRALTIGIVEAIADDPVAYCLERAAKFKDRQGCPLKPGAPDDVVSGVEASFA